MAKDSLFDSQKSFSFENPSSEIKSYIPGLSDFQIKELFVDTALEPSPWELKQNALKTQTPAYVPPPDYDVKSDKKATVETSTQVTPEVEVPSWIRTPYQGSWGRSTSPSSSISQPTFSSSLSSGLQEAVQRHLGIPYVFGGKSASTGLDCSGFVSQVFKSAGMKLSGTADNMYQTTTRVDKRDLKPGDLVFLQDTNPKYRKHGQASHVGIVVDTSGLANGRIRVAESSGTGQKSTIKDWDLNSGYRANHWLGAGRVSSARLGGVLKILKVKSN